MYILKSAIYKETKPHINTYSYENSRRPNWKDNQSTSFSLISASMIPEFEALSDCIPSTVI